MAEQSVDRDATLLKAASENGQPNKAGTDPVTSSPAQGITTKMVYEQKSGRLEGFYIILGPNKNPLHVDLKDYSPAGKSADEVRRLRQDLAEIYQAAINGSPEKADETFNKIAEKFPHGISWQPPAKNSMSHADDEHGKLILQGMPNKEFSPDTLGKVLLRFHDEVAGFSSYTSQTDVERPDLFTENLKKASATINREGCFSDPQRAVLNTYMADNLNRQAFSVMETQVQQQEQVRSA